MTFVEVKFECINWWGNEVYRTKNGTPILRLRKMVGLVLQTLLILMENLVLNSKLSVLKLLKNLLNILLNI